MKPATYSFSDTELSAWHPHFDRHDPTLTHDNGHDPLTELESGKSSRLM